MLLSSFEIQTIFDLFFASNPNPKIELYYTNNFNLAVAVILSAQATDLMVNKVTLRLFDTIISPVDVLEFGLENLELSIRSIGLYKTKAKHIYLMSQKLLNDNHSTIPNNFEYLLTLPGIGRKSANVILNTAFGLPTIAVDTHVKRVSNRIGLTNTNNLLQIELELNNIIPNNIKQKAHHYLVLHGRYICKAIKPQCAQCQISSLCKFTNKNH